YRGSRVSFGRELFGAEPVRNDAPRTIERVLERPEPFRCDSGEDHGVEQEERTYYAGSLLARTAGAPPQHEEGERAVERRQYEGQVEKNIDRIFEQESVEERSEERRRPSGSIPPVDRLIERNDWRTDREEHQGSDAPQADDRNAVLPEIRP